MSTILTIAHREYIAMIGTKAFLMTLVLMPVLMLGGLIILPWATRMEGAQERRVVVADPHGVFVKMLQAAAEARNASLRQTALPAADTDSAESAPQPTPGMMDTPEDIYLIEAADKTTLSPAERLAYSESIRSDQLHALVEIPLELTDPNAPAENRRVKFMSNSGTLSEIRGWIGAILTSAVRDQRLAASGIDPAIVTAANMPVEIVPIRPLEETSGAAGQAGVSQEEEESIASVFAPFLLMMLMFVIIFLAAQPMLESSMEEKTNRISEVLLGIVSPTQLMGGKLLGNVAGSMVVFVLYGLGGFFMLRRFDMLDLLPTHLILWFLVFQILAVLLYSSVFLTIGAAVSQLKEAQSLLLPVWLVLMAPMMIWMLALRDPNGIIATSMSFFPPSAPLMIILRLGTGVTIPAWQAPLAALLLVLTVIAVVVIAGRIYRASLLRGDSVRSLIDLLRRAV